MTNADKYLKDRVDVEEFIGKIKNYFDCPYEGGPCTKSIENFFNQSVKPTLTEDEKVILRSINDRYTKIGVYDDILMLFEKGGYHEEINIFKSGIFHNLCERRRI